MLGDHVSHVVHVSVHDEQGSIYYVVLEKKQRQRSCFVLALARFCLNVDSQQPRVAVSLQVAGTALKKEAFPVTTVRSQRRGSNVW